MLSGQSKFVPVVVLLAAFMVGTEPSAQAKDDDESSVLLSFPTQPLPDFSFDECMGGKVTLESLKGRPWVTHFIFCRCVMTCPPNTRRMMELQRRVIRKNDDVMFVTMSVDPKYDTPEVMREYSEIYEPQRDRWKFVTGDQQQTYELIVKNFGLLVSENLGKRRRPGFEVAHSDRAVLVNADGIPVGSFVMTSASDMTRLERILAGKEEFPEPGPLMTKEDAELALNGPPAEKEPPAENDTTVTDTPAADTDNEPNNGSTQDQKPSPKKPETAAEINAAIDKALPGWVKRLPSINAALNGIATLLLLFGYAAIRRQQKEKHRNLMISAFVMSAAFLACYLIYHYQLGQHTDAHGRKFSGEGVWKAVYFAILIPHVILAVFVPFLAIQVFRHAFAERWDKHKRLAKITFPIWLFVSVTGIVVYGMLYHWPT